MKPFNTLLLLILSSVSFADPPDNHGDYNNNGTVDTADYVLWRKVVADDYTKLYLQSPFVGGILPNSGGLDNFWGTPPIEWYDLWRENYGHRTSELLAEFTYEFPRTLDAEDDLLFGFCSFSTHCWRVEHSKPFFGEGPAIRGSSEEIPYFSQWTDGVGHFSDNLYVFARDSQGGVNPPIQFGVDPEWLFAGNTVEGFSGIRHVPDPGRILEGYDLTYLEMEYDPMHFTVEVWGHPLTFDSLSPASGLSSGTFSPRESIPEPDTVIMIVITVFCGLCYYLSRVCRN